MYFELMHEYTAEASSLLLAYGGILDDLAYLLVQNLFFLFRELPNPFLECA
jgi:hypothetical protein